MRRCLHSLIVGVLTVSLSVDAARACGRLGRWGHCVGPCPPPVVALPYGWDGCGPTVPAVTVQGWAGACGCGETVVVAGFVGGCEEIGTAAALACCGAAVDVVATDATHAVVTESVVAPTLSAEPTPTPAPVAAAVPELEPVEPVAAHEPIPELKPAPETPTPEAETTAAEPESADEARPPEPAVTDAAPELPPMPEETPPVEAEPPAPAPAAEAPKPGNAFEEADQAQVEPADAAVPAEESSAPPVASEEPAVVPDAEPVPVLVVGLPADEPAATDAPASDVPATEPELPIDPFAPEPAPEPAAEPSAAVEPFRRWIDDTASSAVVGRLVDVRGAVIEILKADGRTVTVPLDRLSGFDRDYVSVAGPRLAAARERGPQPRETASAATSHRSRP